MVDSHASLLSLMIYFENFIFVKINDLSIFFGGGGGGGMSCF